MKRFGILLLITLAAVTASGQSIPSNAAYCLYNGGWIPLHASLGIYLPAPPPAVALYGSNGSAWYPLACDVNGNLQTISLTTLGTSGAATLTGTVLNIPVYTPTTAQVQSAINGQAITPTSVTIPADGVHPSAVTLVGNTTLPSISLNQQQHLGPPAATFTSWSDQVPSAIPANGDSVYCAVSGTNCLWTDTGFPYNAYPAANMPAVTTTVSSGSIGTVTTKNTYVICTTTCNLTPMQAAAGVQLCVRNAPGSATVITLNALAASNYYELTTHAGWGTAAHNLVSGGVATDSICLVGYDATHYAVMSFTGTWTD